MKYPLSPSPGDIGCNDFVYYFPECWVIEASPKCLWYFDVILVFNCFNRSFEGEFVQHVKFWAVKYYLGLVIWKEDCCFPPKGFFKNISD